MYRFIVFQVLVGILGGIIASRKGRNPVLWGLLCCMVPLLVLIIGVLPPLVKRGRTKACPFCGKVLQESDTACMYCGKEMPINLVQCAACGSFVPEKDYCMQCSRVMRKE